MQFDEHKLELSIMELFENEGYTHQTGHNIINLRIKNCFFDLQSTYLLS